MIDQRIELQCSGCKTRIRVRLRADKVVSSIPCPSCRNPIPVPHDEGTKSEDPHSMFGRTKPPTQEIKREEVVKDARFQDVSSVGFDRQAMVRQTDLVGQSAKQTKARPPLPEDRPRPKGLPPGELKSLLKQKLEKEKSESLEESSAEEAPAIPEVSESEPVIEEPPSFGDFDESDLDEGLHVFVEGADYGVIDSERLEQIVSSGVWMGAIEVAVDERRVRMDQHPALPILRARLSAKAKNALEQISQEWDREQVDIPQEPEPSEPDFDPTPAPLPETAERKQSKNWLYALVMISVLGVVGAVIWTSNQSPEITTVVPKEKPAPVAPPEAKEFATLIAKSANALAMDSARLRDREPTSLLEDASRSLERSNFGDALDALYELRRRNAKDKAVLLMLSKAQLGGSRFREARETIVALAALEPDHKEVKALFRDAIQRDPAFGWTVKEIGVDLKVDSIKALGGGKSVSFKFKRNGENVFAFKPAQKDWEEGWRGEIAAYRFCEMATCGFKVPKSVPVKVSRRTLERLYPKNSDFQNAYAERFEEIDWRKETVGERTEEYAYGVMKSWIPHFADWPIEYTDIWIEWLNPTIDSTNVYDLPLKEGIAVVKERNPDTWRSLRREFGDTSVREIAAQISNVLLFDFMINNWDRFSEKEEYYGVNNQFADGRFVSIDNGAGFGLRHSTRVQERFDLVGRFSRQMVASLRLITSNYQGFFMPNPSETEKQRMALFWERREQALKYVQDKMKGHNEEVILAFD